jgi:hypothetical protein
MKKIRLTRIIVCEYVPEMKYYPEGCKPDQAAMIDARDWKQKNIDMDGDVVSDNITGDILDIEGTKEIISGCLWVE